MKMKMKTKTILVILADGFEEMEALGTADVLRRLKYQVELVGLDDAVVRGSHNIRVYADQTLDEVDFSGADAIVLPGGLPGSTNLMANQMLLNQLREFAAQGKVTAAICAAPNVLKVAGIIEGKKVTGYPGSEGLSRPDLKFTNSRTMVDGTIVTGQAPGATFEFAARIAEALGTPAAETAAVLQGMYV